MCFVWIWEQTAIISLYSIDCLVGFYNWDGVCLLRGTFYILRSAHTVYLSVLCGSGNKQRLFPYTAITNRCYPCPGTTNSCGAVTRWPNTLLLHEFQTGPNIFIITSLLNQFLHRYFKTLLVGRTKVRLTAVETEKADSAAAVQHVAERLCTDSDQRVPVQRISPST